MIGGTPIFGNLHLHPRRRSCSAGTRAEDCSGQDGNGDGHIDSVWIGFLGEIHRKPWIFPRNLSLKPIH